MFIRGGAQGLLLRKIKMEVPSLTALRYLSLEELVKEGNRGFTVCQQWTTSKGALGLWLESRACHRWRVGAAGAEAVPTPV